ncbi:caspase family protein [Rhizobium lentis]|uniref:WD40 repeat protein/uncharacterized caspase-like protein n=2 Tax=Rhizobium lentis TaxID=1138194 RepID=A0A7W9CY62_9HYPH|nr:caspase family protein [Rhizobium lentis]MBB4576841.1 WD40 repeat protein/uncharacterized caspase-like protein [Rhizobium lentis]MBB5563911.1 WD40 repeat protein/uncharacterized caspase-like protein [Rhizobium lentis]MBB5570351.1 WD40 repeat protein/uncharacterized caspase-like protein [Rhizobium lentis]
MRSASHQRFICVVVLFFGFFGFANVALRAQVPDRPKIATKIGGAHTFLDISASPDEKFLVLSTLDRFILVDSAKGVIISEVSPGSSWVRATAVDPRGRYLVSAANSGLKVWSLPALKLMQDLDDGDYQDVEISADGKNFAAVERNGKVTFWSFGSAFVKEKEYLVEGPLSSVAISPDGAKIAAAQGVNDQTVQEGKSPAKVFLWAGNYGRQSWKRDAHNNDVVDIMFVDGGQKLLSASGDVQTTEMRGPSIHLWDVASGELLSDFGSFSKMVSDLASVSGDTDAVYAATRDAKSVGYELQRVNLRNFSIEPVCPALPIRLAKLAVLPSLSKAVAISNWGTGAWMWEGFPACADVSLSGLDKSEKAYDQIFLPEDNILVLSDSENVIGINLANGSRRFSRKSTTNSQILKVRAGPGKSRFTTLEGDFVCLRSATTGEATECINVGGLRPGFSNFAFLDGRRVALAVRDSSGVDQFRTGNIIIYDFVDRAIMASQAVHTDEVTDMIVFDGKMLTASWDGTIKLVDAATLDVVRTYISSDEQIRDLDVASDGKSFVAGWSYEEDGSGVVGRWQVGSATPDWRSGGYESALAVRFADQGKSVIVGGKRLFELSAQTGQEIEGYPGVPNGESVTALDLVGGEHVIAAKTVGGNVYIWSRRPGHTNQLARVSLSTEMQITIASERFDSRVEDLSPLGWLMPDDPLRPLSPEIFMRDYYEPGLLGRLLACHEAEASGKNPKACAEAFQPVRPLAELNRIQPDVRILSVKATSDPGVVRVTVEASGKTDTTQPNGKTSTGVYDVRLFRNGQLVGQWPEPPQDGIASDDVAAWRALSEVANADGKVTREFEVRLSAREQGKKVTFTAYGFNEDRVKSTTATDDSYTVAGDIGVTAKPRAYVVTIGVNEYEKASLRLTYAAADARVISSSLKGIADYEVIPLTLVSDVAHQDDGRQVAAIDQATKANIHAVLDLLAGKGEGERKRLRAALGDVVDRIRKVTPDDVVVLAFSGHGYAHQGRFYILPSDSGTAPIGPGSVDKLISSEELTAWLREVDAGEMVMIIDACHSAGSVPAGFKPGPMGDRGLGQLAYDKGMRILAATQAADVALESGKYGQGLLTFALKEALTRPSGTRALADADGRDGVSMKEWLTYAEQRVPGLYQEIIDGKKSTRDPIVDPTLIEDVTRHAQTPALFDFNINRSDLLRIQY